jgi:hypothetical protein
MRSSRRTLTAALALVALAASPSLAAVRKPVKLPASKPLIVTDKAGDANLVNSQSETLPADPSQAGPGQYGAADIVSVTVARMDDRKKVLGFSVTFALSEAPGQGVIYRLQGSTPSCGTFWVSYNFPVGGTGKGAFRSDCATPGTTVNAAMQAVVKDKTVTVLLPFSALPKNVKLGQALTVDLVETKGHADSGLGSPAPAPTVPTFDDADGKDAVYKLGS